MEPETKSGGSLVGLVVIIIILVIGGIYIWMSDKNTSAQPTPEQTDSTAVTSQDSASLDTLEQDSSTIDVNTGVDYDAIN